MTDRPIPFSAKPVRLQLSRRKGFDLQALSRATNGLEAVNVSRSSAWGNPFLVHPNHRPGRRWGLTYHSVPTADVAVECYRLMMTTEPLNPEPDTRAYWMRNNLDLLRGKNLSCWCKSGPCHADVLLELANR